MHFIILFASNRIAVEWLILPVAVRMAYTIVQNGTAFSPVYNDKLSGNELDSSTGKKLTLFK